MKNGIIAATILCSSLSFAKISEAARSATFTVTAYCLQGTTASGSHTKPGTVAIDNGIFPFGTRFNIPGYGKGIARDTGGSIQGNHIDVWFSECNVARQWGVRHLRVTW